MHNDMGPPVWVLADDRPGNVGQALGVAEALGLPFAVKPVRYSRLGGLPNPLRGASLVGVTAETRAALVAPWPRLVIAAGRRTAPVARWIKRNSGARLAQVMDPGPGGRAEFDLIAIPNHDGPNHDGPNHDGPNHDGHVPAGANVLRVTGAPHRVTAAKLAEAAAAWRAKFAALPRPWVALIVGGATRRRPFTAAMAVDLGTRVAGLAGRAGGSVLVTTSRRTGPEAEAALLAAILEPRFVHRWGTPGDNPYFGFLGLADAVVVTGDSVSMACEACAAPAPVYLYAPEGWVADKHARLHAELARLGMARTLGGAEILEPGSHPPLNAAEDIARAIRGILK